MSLPKTPRGTISHANAAVLLIDFIEQCDADGLSACFDFVYGTRSMPDLETGSHFIVSPGKYYGGIIEQDPRFTIIAKKIRRQKKRR